MNHLHLSQKEIFFDQLLDLGSPVYNIGTYVVIKGDLNRTLLKKAINSSIERFDVFKFGAYSEKSPEPNFIDVIEPIEIRDVDYSEDDWTAEQIENWLKNRINQPFDLFKDKLYDFLLVKRSENESWLYIGCHHLFSDGYGVPYVLLKYIFDTYHHLKTNSDRMFSAPSYIKLIEKSNDYLDSDSYTIDKEYWKERFKKIQTPIIQSSKDVHSAPTNSVQLKLSEQEQVYLRIFCNKLKISLQDFLIALLAVYFTRIKKVQTFDFCIATHNRTSRTEREVLGAFSKLLPSRLMLDNPTLEELFDQIRTNQRSDYRHKEFPVSHFRQLLQSENNSSSPFDICVNYRYFRLNTIESDLELKGIRNDASYAQTPIEFSWCDFAENGREDLFLEISYRTDCFSIPEIFFLKERFEFLMNQFYHSLDVPVCSIDLLPESETKRLIYGLNQNKISFPEKKTVVDLFEEQVRKTPKNIATVFVQDDKDSDLSQFSYTELSNWSNEFGVFLSEKYTITEGELVGVRLGRNECFIPVLLGVMKSRGVYVPIDTNFPTDRIDFIESQCKCSIDQQVVNEFLKKRLNYADRTLNSIAKPFDLAYVIFTSGSTGRPKGVMIDHRSLVNKLIEERTVLPLQHEINSFCLTNIVFDVSLLEIFLPLLSGGKVVNAGEDYITNVNKCAHELVAHQVNLLQGTPTFFNHFVRFLTTDKLTQLNNNLKVICIGGESLSSNLVFSLKMALPNTIINNHYGPTEITIDAIVYPNVTSFDSNIIGKPLGNTKVYILDNELKPVPFFEEGEIVISGPSVARGYLNDRELSEEVFVLNPFEKEEVMYRTGDLAKVLDSGEIVFLGRKDEQVKVRGYRVELEEIEQVLLSKGSILESAVVVVGENENKQLHAYFTARVVESFDELLTFLATKLPSYMIPSAFIQLDEMPLSSNGKLDKKALSLSKGRKLFGEDCYIQASTELEKRLTQIWEEILVRERIGTNDDFFKIGGYSLQAVKLNNIYLKEFGANLDLKDIFQHSTLADHADLIESSRRIEFSSIPAIMDQGNLDDPSIPIRQFPISHAQQRLWILSQFKEASVAYNMAGSVDLNQKIDRELLQKAFEFLIERHEVLRTVFRINEKDEVEQWIYHHKHVDWKLDFKDLTEDDLSNEYAEKFITQDSLDPFDLENGPLFRASLIQFDTDRFRLYFNVHHIISDGWSLDVLKKELVSFYLHLTRNDQVKSSSEVMEPLRIQYKDYTVWQNRLLLDGSLEKQKSYWLNRLSGGTQQFDLPGYQQRPKMKTYNGSILSTVLGQEITERLNAFVQSEGVSSFSTLLTVWNILFYRYTLQSEITIGTSSAGRTHPDLENQMGFYVNTLAIKNTIDSDSTVAELLKAVKSNVLDSFSNQMYPFDRLVEDLHLIRETSRSPIFDIMFTYLNAHNSETSIFQNTSNEQYDSDGICSKGKVYSKFDVDISIQELEDALLMEVIFNPDVYNETIIRRMMNHFKQLLDSILNNPHEQIRTINYLSRNEIVEQIEIVNPQNGVISEEETVLHLFNEQVAKTPNAVALSVPNVNGNTELTYAELDVLSSRLANYLLEKYYLEPEELVGIKLNRSHWMVVSVIAVLKTGSAFVPIDPEYPAQRIAFIETDSKCKITIDHDVLSQFDLEKESCSEKQPKIRIEQRNLAYVIYTSGSTGNPKGVMLEHGNLYSFLKWAHSEFESTDVDTVLFTTSLNFDLSIFEMLYPFTTGKKVKLLKNGLAIVDHLNTHERLMVNTVPSVVSSLVDLKVNFSAVKALNMAGEPIPENLKRALIGKIAEMRNLYGPSEDTTYSTVFRMDQDDRNLIGQPIAHTDIYLLDDHGQLLPFGSVGEIHIGGAGLFRGYINHKELTDEKLIVNPFKDGERLYKTGDLGKWTLDGQLQFIGRKDDQVKIRGYRIELQEIEHVFIKHPSIDKCTVIAAESAKETKEIVVFYEGATDLRAEELRSFLKVTLPDYMLPVYFIRLDRLPLTQNGKIDKKSLPNPSLYTSTKENNYVAPTTELEKKLVRIWEEVLERENIGVHDDFFSLGGHSLKAVRINNKFQRSLGITLDLDALFSHTTIEAQAKLIETKKVDRFVPIPTLSESSEGFPISDAQRRLWTLNQFEDKLVAYNIPTTIKLEGEYNEHWLKLSFDRLIERHEILRTVFREDEKGEVKQFILSPKEFHIQLVYVDHTSKENPEIAAEQDLLMDHQRPFDFEKGPLLRSSLFKIGQNNFMLYFNIHHVICDAWSLEIMFADLMSFYEAYQKSEGSSSEGSNLKELRIHYKDYSTWQLGKLNSEENLNHLSFWKEQLSGDLPLLNLPVTRQRPRLKTYTGRAVRTAINCELTELLNSYIERSEGTVFMGLLALWNLLMYRYTSQKDIIIGSPVAQREHPDLEDQIGFYVNTVAFRNEIQPDESFDTFFARVKENTLNVYAHQNYPFDRLVDELEVKRGTSRNPIFDVMLILQNEASGKFRELMLSQNRTEDLDSDTVIDLGEIGVKFDIDLMFQEIGDRIITDLIYNSDVYEHRMILQLVQHFKQILKAVLTNPEIEVRKLNFLDGQDRIQLIDELNLYGNEKAYPKNKTIADLFEEQALRTPRKVAIGFSLYNSIEIHQKLSYEELNAHANQLAYYLIDKHEVTPGNLVGVELNRSLDYVIALLGVLKASACCVPINPDFTPEPKVDITSNTKTVIDSSVLSSFRQNCDAYSTSNPIRHVDSSDLAYVLFTSGSAGESKGCMIENRGIINHLYSKIDSLSFDANQRILHTSKMYFVGGIWQLWLPLITGAELIIPELEAIQDIEELVKKSIHYELNVLEVIPSQVSNLFSLNGELNFGGLQTLILTGEPLKKALVNQILKENPSIKIINTYGQTECSDVTTQYEISNEKEWNHRLVGSPIQNTKHYILDENGQLCPLGVTGEIYTAGICVSRGYLNKEELTSMFFKVNPFVQGERLYKTGDIGRWTENGEIECFGRKDDQVKIRGYRVEPGEIEHAVLKHPEIDEAVVTVIKNDNSENDLVVYFTSNCTLDVDELRTFLKKQLVAYMIPVFYEQLLEIPLTSNGKVDKKSLPAPKDFGTRDGSAYVAPLNDIERKLVDIWTRILQREKIGRLDDFFDLGGHSLKAVRLNNAYQRELGLKLTLKDLLTSTTISAHGKLLEKTKDSHLESIPELSEDLRVVGIKNGFPISDAQRRIWVLSQFQESSIAYNMTGALRLNFDVEIEIMKLSLAFLIDRHEALRTVFRENEHGQIMQWLIPKNEVDSLFEFHDFMDGLNNQEGIESFIENTSRRSFDLESGPLLIVALLKRGLNDFILFFNVHHIIGDGWSLDVLSREVFACYEAFKKGEIPSLAPIRIHYKDFVFWQHEQLNSPSFKEHRLFWSSEFAGGIPILDLPSTKQRPRLKTNNGKGFRVRFENDKVLKLRSYTTKHNGSLFTGLLALWNVLFYRYSEQINIIIGTPVAERNHADLENQIGCYVNILALRNEVNPDDLFDDFHSTVSRRFQESLDHSSYPFDRLVDDLQLKRDTSRSAVFDVMLALQEFEGNSVHIEYDFLKFHDLEDGLQEVLECTSKFDLDISFQEVGDDLLMQLIYNSDVYDHELIKQLVIHFRNLLFIVLDNPKSKISEIVFLTNGESGYLLDQCCTFGEYPHHENIVRIFESQVDATPNHTAVIFPTEESEKRMSYSDLDAFSNQLANYLRSNYSIESNDLIGIKLERSEWIPVVILGILKSGGAYVPIDPSSPDQRVSFIEKDTGCKLLLTQEELEGFISAQPTLSSDRLSAVIEPTDLAYIIYTSGTTGTPKGVKIDHHNVVRLFKTDPSLFDFNATDVWTMFHSYAFDFSVWEMYGALLFGGQLVIVPQRIAQDSSAYLHLMEKYGVTILNQTPSSFYGLSKLAVDQQASLEVRTVIFGGEALSPGRLVDWHKHYPTCELINMYGITEGTVHTTYKRIDQSAIDKNLSNIGQAIPTVKCLVLDEHRNLVPTGVGGELYIGGEGVAQGYLNREELTNERFVENPYNSSERLYRTGDKVRLLSSGDLEYLGRIDDQVKIRGYRVELGEVEHALQQHPSITDTVVIARPNEEGTNELVAYIVSREEETVADLRSFLRQHLPEYMLPSHYVQLDELPLNNNGKVDKKVLPNPTRGLGSGMEYVAPETEIEIKLVEVWQEVLQHDKVGIDDDFFNLGGHSLKAIRLINVYQKQFGVKLSLKDLFHNTTIRSLSALISKGTKEQFIQIPSVPPQQSYLLSDAQRRIWVLSQFEDASKAYNVPAQVRLNGEYDPILFERALFATVQRHEILRTVFKTDEQTGEIRQWILNADDSGFRLKFEDFSHVSNKIIKAESFIAEDSYKPFNFEEGPLFRVALIKFDIDDFLCYFNMHHIISDGWSIDVLSKDVFTYYDAFKEDRTPDLPELRIQYKDYASWQQEQLNNSAFERHQSFWQRELSGETTRIHLPSSIQRPKLMTNRGEGLRTVVGSELTKAIKHYAAVHEGTLFTTLLALWKVLLYRYSGQETITIGTPVFGREHADLENQIGCYVNTLVLKNKVYSNHRFDEFYDQVRKTLHRCFEHAAYPFDRLVDDIEMKRDVSRNAIFDVMLVLKNYEESKNNEILQDHLGNGDEPHEMDTRVSKFDLEITFHEDNGVLLHQLIYNPDVYDHKLMKRMLSHFEPLLRSIVDSPNLSLAEIDFLNSDEREKLLLTFNDTFQSHELNQTFLDLFRQQVALSSQKIAVSNPKSEVNLSFQSLDQLSNQLAHYLLAQFNIEPGDLIGLKQHRSEWIIVSILAILKIGAAYVPIDPNFPAERIEFLEKACKCSLGERVLNEFLTNQADYSIDELKTEILPKSLVYTIFTSGSTGEPKGVQVEHGNLYNYLSWAKLTYLSGKGVQGDFGLYSSLSFDLTVTSLFLPLISGHTLHVYPDNWEVSKILEHYFDPTNSLEIIKLTPAHVQLLGQLNLSETNVKVAIVGGEEFRANHVKILKDLNPKIQLFNEYGPTECTVGCIVRQVENEHDINIGKPVANTQAYIVNQENSIQPVGVIGELLIGGNQVARGYLNRNELTTEKFIENPFVLDSMLYRTGDLAKWKDDGTIEYIGRIDDQVKIRGYRIELGEVEHILQQVDSIIETIVIARPSEEGINELVAYLVSTKEENVAEVRSFLSKHLPEYMIPSYFVQLERLPLNNNGKVDKKALLAADVLSLASGAVYVTPETQLEKELAELWQKVLRIERVGVTDDFFHLGGHSLKLVRLINEYQKQFNVKLSLKDAFIHTTIASHSKLISEGNGDQFIHISSVENQNNYELSAAQQRLWVLSQFEDASKAYNMPAHVQLKGAYNSEIFEQAIFATIQRHEILRTVIKRDEQTGEVRQWILTPQDIGFKLGYEDFSAKSDKIQQINYLIEEDSYKPFDFENGPLFRVVLIKLSNDDYLCYFNMHHIISDAWSMDILSKDVFTFYEAFKEDQPSDLPPLRIQYKDYAAWQRKQLEDPSFQKHQLFWLNILSGELPILDLPGNSTRPRIFTQNGRRLRMTLSKSISKNLKKFAQDRGGTLFMGLLASWNVLLHRYTGQVDIIIGTPVAGRYHSDLENQIGAYINSVALRNTIQPSANFNSFFDDLKENTLSSFEHQSYPFDRLVEELQLERDISRNPIFDVMLILQNTEDIDKPEFETFDKEIINEGITRTKLDLGITCSEEEEEGEIVLTLEYNTDIYKLEMIEMLMKHYKELLALLIKSPEMNIGEIDFLSSREKQDLLYPFGNLSGHYPQDKSVIDLFEHQVERTPNKTAVHFSKQLLGFHGLEESIEVSYDDLNKCANRIARYLQNHFSIESNDIIAFQLPRNERLIQLIWGVLKAGAAYLPLNLDSPEDKIEYVKEDSGCKLVVNEQLLEKILEASNQFSDENLEVKPCSDDLIYVIYTSGSTGMPKGVLITHENIVAHIHNVKKLYGVNSESRFLQFFNTAFDAAAQEIFTSLLFGATLYLKTEELDPSYIFELLNTHGITHADFSTAFFSALMSASDPEKYPHQLEFCAIGGEKFEIETLKKQEENIRQFTKAFYNVYGPTETTLIATWFPIIVNGQMTEMGDVIPIGRPYDGRQVVILNESQMLQPVGIVGEICIGGDSVGNGYLNRSELTCEKFIPNPYLDNTKLYRTGDLGKRLPNGQLEFIGRKDDQVKIRGYRIELGEIEHHLLKHPEIDQCVVITKEIEAYVRELVAYFISDNEQNPVELRAYLGKTLPAYMIPYHFVQVASIPLTANGKVDKETLLQMELSRDLTSELYLKPSSIEERLLVEICEGVLKREKIGINDNFYNLGGDSVKSIQVVARLKKRGYSLRVEDILNVPVLEDLALRMKESMEKGDQSVVTGMVELTPIQRWFFSTNEIKKHHHVNQSVLLKSSYKLDLEILEQCLERLTSHHDALRMKYDQVDGKWVQENAGIHSTNYSLDYYNLTYEGDPQSEIERIGAVIQRSIDLKQGPLIKAVFFELKNESRLGIIIHHLVVDGISWRILLEDLSELYAALLKNQTINLPFKTDSFKQWANAQANYAQSELLNNEREYWKLFKSLDFDRLPLREIDGAEPLPNEIATFSLNQKTTELLNSGVHHVYSTEVNDLLLTALGLALKKSFGVGRTILKMEGHGRENMLKDLDITRTVGWFTTMYPFLLDVSDSEHQLETLVRLKDALRTIPSKGIGFGMLQYLSNDGLDVTIDNQILFNFLGDIDTWNIAGDSQLFEFADEQLGMDFAEENRSNVPLNILGVVVRDSLTISIRYSTDLIDKTLVDIFAQSYKEELEGLIQTLSELKEKRTTASDLTFSKISKQEFSRLNVDNNVKDVYELSPLQEGMYYHWLANDSSILYFEEATYRVRAHKLPIHKLERAYQMLIDRHDVLRTHFTSDFAGTSLQIVKKQTPFNFEYVQIDQASTIVGELEALKLKNRLSGFDLETGSQMRLLVIDLGFEEYEFIWSYHHIIMDGWCIGVLVNEFNLVFSELVKENSPNLPEVLPYSNYIKWLRSIDERASLDYWRNYLDDYSEPAEIPFKLEGEEITYFESNEYIEIDGEVFEKIDALCNSLGITMNTFVQSVWGYLLAQYNGRHDVVFGAVVSGRPGDLDGVEDMVGLFNNTVPVRVRYDEGSTPRELLKMMHQHSIESSNHHFVSLAKVQSECELKSDLINHIMVFENYVIKELETEGELNSQSKDGLKIESITYFDQTNYNFNLTVYPGNTFVHINIRFNCNYYDAALIMRMKNHLEMVIERFINNANTPLNV